MSTAFGARLRVLRQNQSVTMKGLARRVRVDPSFLSRIERGVVAVPEHLVRQIAKALKTPEESLLVLAGYLPKDVKNVLHEQPERALAVLRELGAKTGNGRGAPSTVLATSPTQEVR